VRYSRRTQSQQTECLATPFFLGEPLLYVCGILEYVRDQGIDQALEACVPPRPQISKMDQATATGGFFSTRLNLACGIL